MPTTIEVRPRWNKSLTASLLASSASYFLISWQKNLYSRFFVTTVEYFLKIFSWCQLSAPLSAEQKFSHREFFVVYGMIMFQYFTTNYKY